MNIVAKPWEPQDLLDDLQLMIDELPDSYTHGDRTTLCMARDYLKLYFQTPPETAREYAIRTGKCPMCQDCPDGCPLENPRDPKNHHQITQEPPSDTPTI